MVPSIIKFFFKKGSRNNWPKVQHAEILLGCIGSMVLNIYYMKQLCNEAVKAIGLGTPADYDEAAEVNEDGERIVKETNKDKED